MERIYHVQGLTGSGQQTALYNAVTQGIADGNGVCLIDPNIDNDLLEKIICHLKEIGKYDDFFFFSLKYPAKSQIYNPVQNGSPEEIAYWLIREAYEHIENAYYKNLQHSFLLNAIRILRWAKAKEPITLDIIISFIQNFKSPEWVSVNIGSITLPEGSNTTGTGKTERFEISHALSECQKREYSDLSGILSYLTHLTSNNFGSILNGVSQINLNNPAISKGIISYFQLPVVDYPVVFHALYEKIQLELGLKTVLI